MGTINRLIRLVTRQTEIDPYVVGQHEEAAVRLRDSEDSENLEKALIKLARKGRSYLVEYKSTKSGQIYAHLRRTR